MVSLVGRLRASRRLLRAIRTRPTRSSPARLHRGGRFVPPFFFPAPVASFRRSAVRNKAGQFGTRQDGARYHATSMAYSGGVARIVSETPAAGGELHVRELTVRGIILGAILALVLGAANAYLGLYAGMTVSASIPAAVISMALLRILG